MKYPGGVKMSKAIKDISYGNRGMSLEEDLNISNSYTYLTTNYYMQL